MAQIEKEPDNPYSEFIMAIAGPAASFVLSFLFGMIWLSSGQYMVIREPARYLTMTICFRDFPSMAEGSCGP